MKKRRLCLVIPTHWSAMMGGAQYQLMQITERLRSRPDIETVIVAKHFGPMGDSEHYQRVQVGCALPVRFAKGTLLDGPSLWRTLGEINPDIIYQRVGGVYTGICGLFAQRHGRRFVWHIAHDYDVTPGKFAGDGTGIVRWLKKRMLEMGARRATRIIAQTQQQAALVEDVFGRNDALIVRNAHPVPALPFHKDGNIQIIWVANLKRWKRPEVFLELARRFVNHDRIEFLMVGKPSADPRWTQELEQSIAAAGNVRYLGELTQEAVNRLLETGHIFVNTSLSEGFPNTFIQAWMREVPVVSFGFDPDHVLASGQVGYTATNFSDLVDAIQRLITDEALRRRLGKNARAHALEHHSPANFDRILDVLLD